MFEESLVESTALLHERNRWPAVVSVGIQAALAITLVSLPLLHPEVLALHAPPLSITAPQLRSKAPTPPPQPVHVTNAATNAIAAPSAAIPSGPARLSRTDFTTTASAGPDTAPGKLDMSSLGTGALSALVGPSSPAGPSVVARPAARPGPPARVSLGVSQGLLLAPIRPLYPAIAKVARVEGTVTVQAIISKSGQVESAHVVGGPAMLQGAALESVRSARYRPYLLNGEPTEVEATFSINFRLSS